MKENLMRYLLEYKDKSFREAPFSEVDALLLSQLSYLKLDGVVPGFSKRPAMTWREVKAHPRYDHLFSDPVFGPRYRKITEIVADSRRYGSIRLNYYADWFHREQEAQFAAVTFFLGEHSIFVSFRGTDETLVGWKEDFNMSYMKSVPAQRRALAYLKGAARYARQSREEDRGERCGEDAHGTGHWGGSGEGEERTDRPGGSGRQEAAKLRIVLGGHSKGGNLAVYAAANAPGELQRSIRRVYSFDGPGFQKNFCEKPGFRRIEDRYCKIVPDQSVVGMMLANYKKYRVVSSYRAGVVQHDLMNWKIRDGKFVYRKDVYRRSSIRTTILNAWVNSLTREQIAVFVETLYELLGATRAGNVYELMKKPFGVVRTVLRAFRGLEKDRRQAFWEIVRRLFDAVREFWASRYV